MLDARREQIARGWRTPRRSKPSWPRPKSQRQEVLAQARSRGGQAHRERARCRRARQEQETQKAIAAAEQIMATAQRSRRPGSRPHAGRTQARGRAAGGADDGDGDRQDPDAGRPAAAGRGNRRGAWRAEDASMATNKTRAADRQAVLPILRGQRIARRGASGRSSQRVIESATPRCAGHAEAVPAAGPARSRAALARVESAAPLPDDVRARDRGRRRAHLRPRDRTVVRQNPALIGGVRLKVGSDVYDGSVRADWMRSRPAFEPAQHCGMRT